jgi:putative methionine-R-sulfoxide reductase with GAF domain
VTATKSEAEVSMSESEIVDNLTSILDLAISRAEKSSRIAEAIRVSGSFRWVGLYDVNMKEALVFNIAWSGPKAPAWATFPITKGLTSRAIATKQIINVGDVATDSDYLTAFGSTLSEIIVPVVDAEKKCVVGTIDVESEKRNAFDKDTEQLLATCAEALRPLWAKGPATT